MIIALFSDIHSNYFALDAVLNDIEKRCLSIDEFWFTGDLLGYGPHALNVLRVAKQKFQTNAWILGNHDALYAGYILSSLVREEAVDAILKNTKQIKQDAELSDWIEKFFIEIHQRHPLLFDFKIDGVSFALAHGCLKDANNLYVYPWTSNSDIMDFMINPANQLFTGKKYPWVVLFGHSHVPALFHVENGLPQDVKIEFYGKPYRFSTELTLINPGSIGQPRDMDTRASYAILDTEEKTVTYFRSEYDVLLTAFDLQKGKYSDLLKKQLLNADGLGPPEEYKKFLFDRKNNNRRIWDE